MKGDRGPFPRGLHGVSSTADTFAEAIHRADRWAGVLHMRYVVYRITDPDPASPPWRWHPLGIDGQCVPLEHDARAIVWLHG